MHELARLTVGSEKRLNDGSRIEVIPQAGALYADPSVGSTPDHEARHLYVAKLRDVFVLEASVIPEAGSLGHITTLGYDAPTVAAPAAYDCPGVGSAKHPGSDLWQIANEEKRGGMRLADAKAIARKLLDGRTWLTTAEGQGKTEEKFGIKTDTLLIAAEIPIDAGLWEQPRLTAAPLPFE